MGSTAPTPQADPAAGQEPPAARSGEPAPAQALRALCREDEIAEGGARGFPPPPGGFIGLFAVRSAGRIVVYLNSCPHIGVPLDWAPDRFLTADGSRIICATHGAEFRIADGACLHGPCRGQALQQVPVTIANGVVLVSAEAGL